MKKLAIVIVVAAALWSAWWVIESRAVRGAVEDWFAAQRAEGRDAAYGELSVGGFPNRVDVRLRDVTIYDPETETGWQAPRFEVFRLIYDRSHYIFALAQRQEVTVNGDTYVAQGDGLRASLVLGPDATLGRLHVEADTLAVDGPDTRVDLSGLRANLDAVSEGASDYRLAVSSRDGPKADREITVRAELNFEAPPTLSGEQARLTGIDMDTLDYALPDARLRLSGELDVDGRGRLSGDVDLQAEDWQALLDSAVTEGRVPEEWAEAAELALDLVASLRGGSDTLDVGLRLDDGTIRLGPVTLGEAPRIPVP